MRSVIAFGLAMILLGCTQPGTSPNATSPPSVGAEVVADCPDLELRSPSGSVVDLTGTWRGNNDAYWQFVQVGECVWATSTDNNYAHSLRGQLIQDFSVAVEYVHLAGSGPARPLPLGYGHATLQIEFSEANGAETLTLHKIAGCSILLGESETGVVPGETCQAGEVPLQTDLWTRVSETPLFPLPTPGH